MQINQRFYLIKRGYTVVDLGASPGGWSQVARKIVGEEGRVIGVDLNPLRVKGVDFIRGDVFSDETVARILEKIEYADVVISDMAPKLSGIGSLDHARSIELAEQAFFISRRVLKEGGHMVVKVFQGDMLGSYLKKLRKNFDLVKVHKPQASTASSAETYVICKRFIRSDSDKLGELDKPTEIKDSPV
jgi:23S rRNA (uridine2552-2'-O)-methyltransferase